MRVSATSRTAVVRTRMPGGVGGAEPRGSPLSRSLALRYRRRGIELTAGIGGAADMDGRRHRPAPTRMTHLCHSTINFAAMQGRVLAQQCANVGGGPPA